MAPLAMPSMTVGNNRFTYLEHTDDKSGANAARHLKITHNWVERSKTRPPQSVRIAGLSGQTAAAARARMWCSSGTPPRTPTARPSPIIISSFRTIPTMRWPMSPNFDKYISRTPDKGKARYTLPRPGLLTHGKTYYWHVKAKDANGVWGPWSDTWSFTAEGPAYPVNLAIKHNAASGIGTLTMERQPGGNGRPPSTGYTAATRRASRSMTPPIKSNLATRKGSPTRFPRTSWPRSPALPWMLWAWATRFRTPTRPITASWRWTAWSRRSGDSDYVEAPRPFIFSTPVTSAPAGQPYRYQVKSIRSLGDLTRRDAAKPKPGTKFWKIEPLRFSLTQKPGWMSINADTGLITGTSDGTGGTVTVSVTLTKEHRLVHDKDAIVWGNEYEQSRTYETVGPVTQQFSGAWRDRQMSPGS